MNVLFENLSVHNGFFACPTGEFYLSDVRRSLPGLIRSYGGKVKMIYLDPPFMTGRDFDATVPVGERGFAGDRAFCPKVPLYSDTWKTREEYLSFLKEVFLGARELLQEDGVICVHVDRHAAAHVRLLLDEVFGERSFINEIIWHYHSGGSGRNTFPAKHDNIYIYGRHPGVHIDPGAAGKERGEINHNHMKRSVDENGRAYSSIVSNGKEYRYYEDEKAVYDDVWDIPHLQQKHPERTGFGTQKPLELLNRLVLACSKEGDLVADLFAGSGTTLISAAKLSRRFLGVDHSEMSLLSFRRRITELDNFELTVYYPEGGEVLSGVNLHKKEADGRTTVTVDGFSMLDGESILPRLQDGTQYLTYLALGKMREDGFHTEEFSIRTNKKPSLQLSLSVSEDESLALYCVDCLGGRRFVRL